MTTVMRGMLAGASGAAALNLVTYLDIAARGRGPSSTPEQSAGRLAALAGVDLGDGGQGQNRASGVGALRGYATGLGAGAAVGLVAGRRPSWPVAALALTALAMIGSNAPMTALGVSDPRTWSARDWVVDAVPHLADGAVAATTLRALGSGSGA